MYILRYVRNEFVNVQCAISFNASPPGVLSIHANS
jgi:hypothetical protein